MAGLPAAHLVVIDERKITHYLLADGHPAGRGKAAFFARLGFSLSNWQSLREALRDQATRGRVVSASETDFGKKYILEGDLTAPSARAVRIRTVWFVPRSEAIPKLVTAYPVRSVRR